MPITGPDPDDDLPRRTPRRGMPLCGAVRACASALIAAAALFAAGCGDASPDGEATDTAPGDATAERCESPAGFSVAIPEGWHTNPGNGVPSCTQFHPEPFELPGATDRRVAAITASVEPVPLEDVTSPLGVPDPDVAEVEIDGMPAVRLSYRVGGRGLFPPDTPITLYALDVADRTEDERDATLVLDTVGVGEFDYERNVRVLDEMAGTVRITLGREEDADTSPDPVGEGTTEGVVGGLPRADR
jgi:hypothetical protein